jgi:hypothetical protein
MAASGRPEVSGKERLPQLAAKTGKGLLAVAGKPFRQYGLQHTGNSCSRWRINGCAWLAALEI